MQRKAQQEGLEQAKSKAKGTSLPACHGRQNPGPGAKTLVERTSSARLRKLSGKNVHRPEDAFCHMWHPALEPLQSSKTNQRVRLVMLMLEPNHKKPWPKDFENSLDHLITLILAYTPFGSTCLVFGSMLIPETMPSTLAHDSFRVWRLINMYIP